jgi:hypothetical protein
MFVTSLSPSVHPPTQAGFSSIRVTFFLQKNTLKPAPPAAQKSQEQLAFLSPERAPLSGSATL